MYYRRSRTTHISTKNFHRVAKNIIIYLLVISLGGSSSLDFLLPAGTSAHVISFAIGICALFLQIIFIRRRVPFHSIQKTYIFLVLIFCVYSRMSLGWSNVPVYGKYKSDLMIWNLLPLLAPILILHDKGQLRRFLIAYLMICSFSLLLSVYFSMKLHYNIGIRDTFGEPIILSRLAGITVLLALALWSVIGRYLSIILVTFGISLAFFSGTRAAFWSIFIVGILRSKERARILLPSLAMVLIVSLFSWAKLGTDVSLLRDRITSPLQQLEQANFASTLQYLLGPRLDRGILGLHMWQEAPVLGQGMGSFAGFAGNEDTRDYPHNVIIEILAEQGILGLLLFVCSFYAAAKALKVARRRSLGISEWKSINLMLIYGFLAAQFSLDMPNQWFLWVPMGLAAASLSCCTDQTVWLQQQVLRLTPLSRPRIGQNKVIDITTQTTARRLRGTQA